MTFAQKSEISQRRKISPHVLTMPQKVFIAVLFLVLLVVGGVIFFLQQEQGSIVDELDSGDTSILLPLSIKNVELGVRVVGTSQERQQGLSGRAELAENEGMLFIFEEPQEAGIWMKDMNFSIDILWLDGKKQVIHIKEGAAPESFPEIFRPQGLAMYVLEVQDGFAKEHDIRVGDVAQWSLE